MLNHNNEANYLMLKETINVLKEIKVIEKKSYESKIKELEEKNFYANILGFSLGITLLGVLFATTFLLRKKYNKK